MCPLQKHANKTSKTLKHWQTYKAAHIESHVDLWKKYREDTSDNRVGIPALPVTGTRDIPSLSSLICAVQVIMSYSQGCYYKWGKNVGEVLGIYTMCSVNGSIDFYYQFS